MPREMKRIVNIANGFNEAAEWDIKQQISMTPNERFAVVKKLKEMVYGKNNPDIREWYKKK